MMRIIFKDTYDGDNADWTFMVELNLDNTYENVEQMEKLLSSSRYWDEVDGECDFSEWVKNTLESSGIEYKEVVADTVIEW